MLNKDRTLVLERQEKRGKGMPHTVLENNNTEKVCSHKCGSAVLTGDISVEEKLRILGDGAKYDVACTSSGADRKGNGVSMGSAKSCGICHTFTPDGRCISLLKILFTNECIFDCKYCINRASNDVPRATFTPDEICSLTMEFYRRNYIEGLFLSSGILKSPNYTVELIYETIYKLRNEYHFNGYVHAKAIPGADAALIERLGYLADRMSINIELPTGDGLRRLAPNKSRKSILTPMKEIQTGIKNNRYMNGMYNKKKPLSINDSSYFKNNYYANVREELTDSGYSADKHYLEESRNTLNDNLTKAGYDVKSMVQTNIIETDIAQGNSAAINRGFNYGKGAVGNYIGTKNRYFVPAGQSTQMIIGATDETDYHIINVSEALYNNYDLKRVFYSAFINVNNDAALPETENGPELLREHRLYQADWLLRYYGFKAGELLTEDRPYFNKDIDPKCDWAVRHLGLFPVEINKADYYTLLRVPGIGVRSAGRIIAARRYSRLDFNDIKRMGVVLKRALYFITCGGRMMYDTRLEENYITHHLMYNERPDRLIEEGKEITYTQMSLFDFGVSMKNQSLN